MSANLFPWLETVTLPGQLPAAEPDKRPPGKDKPRKRSRKRQNAAKTQRDPKRWDGAKIV